MIATFPQLTPTRPGQLTIREMTKPGDNPRLYVVAGYPHTSPVTGLFGRIRAESQSFPRLRQGHQSHPGQVVVRIGYSARPGTVNEWDVRVEYGQPKEAIASAA